MKKALLMRVHHPVFGEGTVEGMDYTDRNQGLLRIKFDRENLVRYFSPHNEPFIAEVFNAIIERW